MLDYLIMKINVQTNRCNKCCWCRFHLCKTVCLWTHNFVFLLQTSGFVTAGDLNISAEHCLMFSLKESSDVTLTNVETHTLHHKHVVLTWCDTFFTDVHVIRSLWQEQMWKSQLFVDCQHVFFCDWTESLMLLSSFLFHTTSFIEIISNIFCLQHISATLKDKNTTS